MEGGAICWRIGKIKKPSEIINSKNCSGPLNTVDKIWYIPYHTIMDIDKLNEWKVSVEAEIQTLKDKIQVLNGEIQQKSLQIDLICKLIDSARSSSAPQGEGIPALNHSFPKSQMVTPAEVNNNVYEILAEAQRPMNIKEIHAEFIRQGYPIPGKGTHFNIL